MRATLAMRSSAALAVLIPLVSAVDCGVGDVFASRSWWPWSTDYDWAQVDVGRCESLSGLDFVPPSGLEALVSALASDGGELRSLDLRGAPLTDQLAQGLAEALATNSVLERIDLRGAALSASVGQTLSAALTLGGKGMKELAIDHDAVIPIDELRGGSTHLNLAKMGLGDAGAIVVFDILALNDDLRELYVAFNRIGEAGGEAVARMLRSNTALSVLVLAHNKLGPRAATAIGDALRHNSALTHLSLDYNAIGDAGGRAIGYGLRANKGLDFLSLWYNDIGDLSGKAIGDALTHHGHLSQLMVDYNKIGDEGGAALGEGIAKTDAPLRVFTAHDNSFGDAAALALAEGMKGCSTLDEVNLDHNAISDTGAAAMLTALWESEALTEFSMDSNPTSSGMHHALEALAGLDPVKRLATAVDEREAMLDHAMGRHHHRDEL